MQYTDVCRRRGNIYVRGWEDGKRYIDIVKFAPTLYTLTSYDTQYKELFTGRALKPIRFESIADAYDFVKLHDGSATEIFGTTDWVNQYIVERFPDTIDYDESMVRIGVIDIETDSEHSFSSPTAADNEIIAITLYCRGNYYVLGLKPFEVPAGRTDVQYCHCPDEATLLKVFLKVWDKVDLDIISGWNSDGYDMPYIINRIAKVLGSDELTKLSPWRHMPEVYPSTSKSGMQTLRPRIDGIACMDFMMMYMNPIFTTGKREEYTLDYISRYELDDAKTNYNQYGSLDQLYKANPQLFIEYNIHDVELVVALIEKLKYFDIVYSTAYDAHVNFVDTLGSVHIWESIIYRHLAQKNVFSVANRKPARSDEVIAGGYVKPPIPGRYKWIVSFDASSLYPSIMRQLNISPETYRGIVYDVDSADINGRGWDEARKLAAEKNYTIASNGAGFVRDTCGMIPELMEHFYGIKTQRSKELTAARKQLAVDPKNKALKVKVENLKSRVSAVKITLNSAYGATANPYFKYFNNRVAEAVTLSGQTLIQTVANELNAEFNRIIEPGANRDYVVASDTDSVYVDCSAIVRKAQWAGVLANNADTADIVNYLERLCSGSLRTMMDRISADIATKTNARSCVVSMAREAIADDAVWIAGKNYVIRVWNNKGVAYKEPEYKIMGWDAVRSTTPSLCREALKRAAPIVLDDDQDKLLKFIDEFKVVFDKADPALIGKNSNYKTDTLVTTQAMRAGSLYNDMVYRKKLTMRYPPIKSGSKIRVVTLKTPNPTESDVIGFPNGNLPKEFELDSYIDRDAMFDKLFMAPLGRLAHSAGMQTVHVDTLSAFM